MNELEKMTLRLIGEDTDSPDVFTDDSEGMAQIRDSLNDAIEEISMISGMAKKDYYIPLEGDMSFYRLRWTSGSFAWVTDAWLVTQKRRLEATDVIRLYNYNPHFLESTGPPTSYYQVGLEVIGVHPTPTSDSDTLVLTCVIIPGRYTSEHDRIKLRDSYKWAAVNFAVSEYWASRGDAKTAMYHFDEYLRKMGMQQQYPMSAEYKYKYRTSKEPWPKASE